MLNEVWGPVGVMGVGGWLVSTPGVHGAMGAPNDTTCLKKIPTDSLGKTYQVPHKDKYGRISFIDS